MTDAQRMHTLREELNLSQSEMAKLTGYNSKDAISKIERGERKLSGPARKCLELIAEYELDNATIKDN